MDQSSRRRAAVLQVLFCALFFALIVRLYCIQVAGHETYLAERDGQTQGHRRVETVPGAIKDRHDQILALSCPVEAVWVNPSALAPAEHPAAARALARVLGIPEAELIEKLSGRHGRKYVLLKHRLSTVQAQGVRALMDDPPFRMERRSTDPKLGLLTEYQRQYPHGTLFANALGHDSADPGHEEGLERSLASFLRTPPQSVAISHDGKQQELGAPFVDLSGAEATLTIDLLLQRIVEEELEAACAEFHPRWAVAVVMDPRSGELLALANRPTFDPNQTSASPAEARLDRAVSAPYEPGSTLKPFTAAFALDLGLIRPDTIIDCENGLWHHGPRTLHDHHPYSKITLADVIKYSSNIGAAKIGALTLGQKRLYECMKRWGFGERTGVDLPAEDSGLLFPLSKWTIYSETSVPMGHEISVTPLQLVTAMSAIANGGTLYRPFVVRRVASTDGTLLVDNGPQAVRRVIGQKACLDMVEILKGVVEEGTGKKAAVPGIKVAGKTGTSQKIDPRTHQYTHERYIASFVGFAPADDAKLCIAVVLDEPQGGSYYGGAVAAPVVGKILQRGLIYVK